MTHCRICQQMTLAIGFDDHETICAACLTEAVRDPEVIEIRVDAEPIPVPPLPDDIFSDELAGLLDTSFPEPAVAGLLELPAPFPFPADLTDREAELIDRFFSLDADEQAALLDELDGTTDEDDDAPPDERDRLFAELGFAAPFIPESRDDRPGDAAADEYPGYRHFRVIESDWVDGDRRWIIRDVYRKAD